MDHIGKFDDVVHCPNCGQPMKREFHSSFGVSMGECRGAYGHYNETLGCYIHTNKQFREECRRQGVAPRPSKRVWFR